MNNATFLAAIMGPIYLVFGISLLIYAKEWVKLIKEWEKNHYVMVIGMMFSLIIGLIIINMYNVWKWNIWIVVTLTGWIAFSKGVFYFLAPEIWIKKIIRAFNDTSWLYLAGVTLCILGVWLGYAVYPIQ